MPNCMQILFGIGNRYPLDYHSIQIYKYRNSHVCRAVNEHGASFECFHELTKQLEVF